MDAQWLQDTVGEPLALGLSKLSYLTIDDPVEYLAKFLIQYADNQEAAAARVGLQERVIDLEQKEHLAEEARNKAANVEATDAGQVVQRLAELEEILKKSSEHYPAEMDDPLVGDKLQGEYHSRLQYFADTLKGMIDANAVYIGKKLDENAGIEYVAATRAAKHVVGKVQAFEADEEGQALNYPFEVFEPVIVEEGEDEDGGADGDEDAEGNEDGADQGEKAEPEVPLPTFINVPSLVQDPKVHTFGVPKHGAYLAIHAPYVSSLHVGALPDIAANGEAAEGEDGTDPSGGEGGDNADQTEEDASAATGFKANKDTKSLVVCCDTMGTGRKFTIDEVATARALVVAFTQGLSALSDAQFQVEMNTIKHMHENKENENEQLTNLLSQAEEAAKERYDAFLEANEEAPEEEKAMQEAKFVLNEQTTKITTAEWVKDALTLLKQLWLAPSTEGTLAPLLASLHLLGVLPKSTTQIDWTGEFKAISADDILSGIEAFAVESVSPEDTEELGAALDACGSAENIRAESVVVGAIFTMAHAALNYVKAHQVHEAYMAELKAAEEAARAEEEEAARIAAEEAAEEDDE